MHGGTLENDDNKFRTGFIDFTAGSLAGMAQVFVSQPLDTIKVKQQTFPAMYNNMVDCCVRTYRKDGIIRGLYAGTLPAIIANVAENSVLFAAYGACQKVVGHVMGVEKTSDISVLGNAFAGFFAAFFSTFSLCPTELVKCKLQALRELEDLGVSKSAKRTNITTWNLTKEIYNQEGIRGFFRGLTPTFFREMPGYFFFFGSYEGTRELFRKQDQTKDDIGPFKTMAAGAVGGATLWISIFPADVIKSRMQINNLNGSMATIGFEIFRKEGLMALYNGLMPSIIRTIPATATLFVIYEYTKKLLAATL